MKFSLLITLFLTIATYSCAEQIGRGSFCIGTDTNFKKGCDHEVTNLVCFEGRCTCPTSGGAMSRLNIPSNLNTRWDSDAQKCFATLGFMCDLHPTKKQVDCAPGVKCLPDPNNKGAGTCAGTKVMTFVTLPLFILLAHFLL